MKQTDKHTHKLSHKERKELSRIEEDIEKASEQVDSIKTQMQVPAIQSNAARLLALSEQLQDAEEKVEKLYRRWEELDARDEE